MGQASREAAGPDLYIGLMSGTSIDSIDAVLVSIDQSPPRLLARLSLPIPSSLREAVAATSRGNGSDHLSPITFGELDQQFGILFADAAERLIVDSNVDRARIAAIGSHGQTLWHQPAGRNPFTLQIGDPNQIAERTGITTVADFRRRDMAAGGQGAPLVPAFHAAMLADPDRPVAVLNIGGIANLTTLDPGSQVTGFDTGPGNLLLDEWASHNSIGPCDRGGEWAASGWSDQEWLARLLDDPYFQAPAPKSTGRERFNWLWLQHHLPTAPADPAAVQATLSELTATTIVNSLKGALPACERLIVCGGGVHNIDLIERIRRLADPCSVTISDSFGIDPDWMEAIAFAWLARQTLHQLPGNLPTVTGARHPVVLGAIYPGACRTQEPVGLWMNRPQKRDNGTTFPKILGK